MNKYFALLTLCFSSLSFAAEELEVLVSPQMIAKKLQETAKEINKNYQGESITIIMVMKGAICLTSDLIRNLKIPVTLEYVQANTYGDEHGPGGKVRLTGIEKLKVKGKNILIVDDVLDSGNTLSAIIKVLKEKHPKSLKSLVLFSKKTRDQTVYYPDFELFNMNALMKKFPDDDKNRVVVGYGIDYNGHYRELPGLYILEEK